MTKYIPIAIILAILALFACGRSNAPKIGDTKDTTNQYQEETKLTENILQNQPRAMANDTPNITGSATITTSYGNITIGLYGDDAPLTVRNFKGLVQKGYYNGILFHRVAKNFLIQTGDRETTVQSKKTSWGKGGESIYGKEFDDELNSETPSYKIGYIPGTVAMANHGPNTNTSQFFICLDDAMRLEPQWTIFGKVMNGMDVVKKISDVEVEPSARGTNDGFPKKPVKIISVSVK
jgi:cyclophilin family peptidyl-prolyl cis-trans isomerase